MGDWRAVGEDLVDAYLGAGDEDMKEFAELIHDRIGCQRCKAFDFCYEYKDEVFDGECYKVLTSFFEDREDEDTAEYREKRAEEARIQAEEDWHSWNCR